MSNWLLELCHRTTTGVSQNGSAIKHPQGQRH